MTVPSEIVAALAGWPEAGSWEPTFPLLTVDESGFPHVCLLSRAELHADAHRVYAVLASPTTVRNLSRRPAATVVVVLAESADYLKVRAVHISQSALTGVDQELP
jgi:Pyridoxamine 5'-phosphate oxidase